MSYRHIKAHDLARNGEWDAAHEIVQDFSDELSCLIHAYLHRVESDESNTAYWYRRAGVRFPDNVMLSLSTIFTFWYYGAKCPGFLIGADKQEYYVWIYASLVVLGAVASLDAVIGLIDGMYAVMAIPTMVSALLLAKKIKEAAKVYFSRL